jgi:2-methylcitrate dehydratase
MDRNAAFMSAYAAGMRVDDVTASALHAVKRSLVDSIGCALGAYAAEPVKIARRLATRTHSDTPATLWGTHIRTSPEMAAFVNGIMVRYLDYSDDYLKNDGPHPSDTIPPLLAIAEARHADGATLACAITLAYEIVDQLVDCAQFKARGWDYVTETAMGAALGAGKIMGLAEDEVAQALALATVPNIALRQTRTGELSMWKGCAGPNAARNGLFAALLAAEGMTGPNDIFEGRHGLWQQVTGPFELGTFGGKGRPFKIEETYFKSRPVQYTGLLPVETALALHSRVDPSRIRSIRVVLDEFSVVTGGGREKYDPQTRETADHSHPFLVAAALVDGEISDATFTPVRYRDPRILALMQKITLEEDPAYTRAWPRAFECRVEVTDDAGATQTQYMKNPKGHPANPMSDAEIEEKFLHLTAGTLGSAHARSVLRLLWNLEACSDVGEICSAIAI